MYSKIKKFFFKNRYYLLILFLLLLSGYYFCLPSNLFKKDVSTVLFDKEGILLGAKIAKDGQWRFPHNQTVPEKFAKAIICFEDKRFYGHWGVDFLAVGRAILSNLSSGERQSGASTLSMQVIRLSRNNPKRTIPEKLWEMILATRLEWGYSKNQILAFYAANAPFGANVVGLDAASWKYFSRAADKLSWAEAAMLAVLPNSPSLIHLNKNRLKLKHKRDRLLDRMFSAGIIDEMTCRLSKLEELPEKPKMLPRLAPQLLEKIHKEDILPSQNPYAVIYSTIDAEIQERISEIVEKHSNQLAENLIFNAAALVIDAKTGDVLAYIGNTPGISEVHAPSVDLVQAKRSSGSIFKPLLYAAMLHDGDMLPNTVFPDVPSQFGAYVPKNFDLGYDGIVSASEVVSRSLNVPAVHMLHRYSPIRFYHKLKELGAKSLFRTADDYGLTLVLGGAETNLWDLGSIYSSMTRNLWHYGQFNSTYAPEGFVSLNYYREKSLKKSNISKLSLTNHSPLSASAIWYTFEAMQEVGRPGVESYWENFTSSGKIAWKTGTSYGFRDAWAVGLTPEYVVAVWVGNADGEGRPGIIGAQAAGPLLFDIFNFLGASREWFQKPYDDMVEMEVCSHSGALAGAFCPKKDSVWLPLSGRRTTVCKHHQTVYLSSDKKYRVHSDCESPSQMQADTFFLLTPSQEWYYSRKNPTYRSLPVFRKDCIQNINDAKKSMELIYPQKDNVKIYVPKNLNEEKSRTVFEAAHSNPKTLIYWHLDDIFVGTTKSMHSIELNPAIGKHTIVLVDEHGERLERYFEVLEK